VTTTTNNSSTGKDRPLNLMSSSTELRLEILTQATTILPSPDPSHANTEEDMFLTIEKIGLHNKAVVKTLLSLLLTCKQLRSENLSALSTSI
jgi:hypothetical protein